MAQKKFNYAEARRKAGISYLGATKQSTKLTYSYNNGWNTYGIYLAPSTLARDAKHPYINNCPFSQMCAESCLNGSGQNKIQTLKNHFNEVSFIDKARIRKTHLFYDNRELFMKLAIHEIRKAQRYAKKHEMGFAIRLNCTSDISPTRFIYKGQNILEIFSDVQFYDYTKVPSRLALAEEYANYDLVFSYDGTNWEVAEEYLKKGGKVAVVFDIYDEKGHQTLPSEWRGYSVIDANGSDTRFLDPKGTIMGLHYHRVANDYKNGKYEPADTPFVVREL